MAKMSDFPALPLGVTPYHMGQRLRREIANIVSYGESNPGKVSAIIASLTALGDVIITKFGGDPSTSTTVSDGNQIDDGVGGTYDLTVEDSVLTIEHTMAATRAHVVDAQVIPATGGTITLDVTAGVVTGVFTPT